MLVCNGSNSYWVEPTEKSCHKTISSFEIADGRSFKIAACIAYCFEASGFRHGVFDLGKIPKATGAE